jgi:hypothetical protein
MVLTDAAKRAMRGDTSVEPSTVNALAEALLEADIDVSIVNANRQTALDVARAINLPHKAPLLAALSAAGASTNVTAKTRIAADDASPDVLDTTATSSTNSAATASTAAVTDADHDGEADKPRKRISLQQHDFSRTVGSGVEKRRSGHKKGGPAEPAHEGRARSKSTSVHRQATRAASSTALQPTYSIGGSSGAKTSDLKRGDRLLPGPSFKLNLAAIEIRSTPATQANTPTEADRRAQTARVIPSLGNVPVPILRSPREAQPPITLGLGALISPRALRDHKSSSSKKSKKSTENSENDTKSTSLNSSPARRAPAPAPTTAATTTAADDNSDDNSQDLMTRVVKKLDLSDIPPPLPPLSSAVTGTPPKKQRHHRSRHGQSAPVSPRGK